MFDGLLNHLNNAPKREVVMTYVASFRLPTFTPGEEHGRDFILIASLPTRAGATAAMDASIALNANGTVLIREGRKVHQYTWAGIYLGHYTVTAQEKE